MKCDEKYQMLADEYAQKSGRYAYALYLGIYDQLLNKGEDEHEWILFRSMYGDTMERKDDIPSYFLMDDKGIVPVANGSEILQHTHRCDEVERGKQIYEEYCKLLWSKELFGEEHLERRMYIKNLVYSIDKYQYDAANDPHDLYLMLQAAERLGKMVKMTPYDWCKHRYDGWVYYYQLI